MEPNAENDTRPDNPRGGWFNLHYDAVYEASRRASLIRRKYRVHYDPHNRWWNITETNRNLGCIDK